MENGMVSVIVVCFNELERIEKTLDSILRQSHKKMECVVVDGGSEDGTLEVIENYKRRFLHSGITIQIISEKDHGIYDAMNKGVKNANGEWILFLNAGDNFHEKDVVEKTMSKAQNEDEIIIGKIVFFDGFLGREIELLPIENLKKDMIFCHQAIFAKKELLKKHCFDIFYRYCADYEWLLAMFLEGRKLRCIDIVIADYDGDGISSKNENESRSEMRQIQKKYGLPGEGKILQINRKYRLYREIGKYKFASFLFYFLYGKRKNYYYNMK